MKPAKQWHEIWSGDACPCPDIEQITAIQSDAYKAGLLRALELCFKALGSPHDPSCTMQNLTVNAIAFAIEQEAHEEAIKEAK